MSLSRQNSSDRRRRLNGEQADERLCLKSRTPFLRKTISNEKQLYVNHRVSALDPLLYSSPGGRHPQGDGAGNAHKPHCHSHLCLLAVRNASARRTAIGVHHHPPRRALFVGRPPRAHEGQRCRHYQQTPQLRRTLLFRLDTDRDWSDRSLLRHSLSTRAVEPALAPVAIMQTTRTWSGPSHGVCDRSLIVKKTATDLRR